ncbi:hypothetical protein AB0M10_15585 [Streptomyces sp. NPDC051840]|uniref:hypothetical protein n=1 Tax=Streptomyces sp. NPDC051840 TaxID=3154752 RepID=UPI00342DAB49
MIGGDLDAAPLPAEVYVVWEGLVGIPGRRYTPRRLERRMLWHRHKRVLALYDTNAAAVRTLWRLWEADHPVSIVTYLPHEVAAHLHARMERDGVPYRRLLVDEPEHMGRNIALLQGVGRIVHSIPEHNLRYGPKGFLCPPQSPELILEILP